MKKVALTFILFITAHFAFAQDAFKTDMKKYMELSGQLNTFEMLTKELENNIPEAKRVEFNKELKSSLSVLMDKMAEMYMTEFTHDDVKEMIKFYESPVGKKLNEKSAILFEKGQQVGQEWAMGLQGVMMKYMEE